MDPRHRSPGIDEAESGGADERGQRAMANQTAARIAETLTPTTP
jgi:hypothetical protein